MLKKKKKKKTRRSLNEITEVIKSTIPGVVGAASGLSIHAVTGIFTYGDFMLILFVILVVLNVADVALTHKILKRGGRELNPFLEPLFRRFNPVAVMVVTKLVYLAPLAIFINIVPMAALYVLNTLYAALLLWNVKEYIKQRRIK